MKYVLMLVLVFMVACSNDSEEVTKAQELLELESMFNEIKNISLSVECSDANDWLFTAYGSKACGGPQGYIAYSKNIDTETFIKKIEEYTSTENTFNLKYGVVSDCMALLPPTNISCENGKAVLQY